MAKAEPNANCIALNKFTRIEEMLKINNLT